MWFVLITTFSFSSSDASDGFQSVVLPCRSPSYAAAAPHMRPYMTYSSRGRTFIECHACQCCAKLQVGLMQRQQYSSAAMDRKYIGHILTAPSHLLLRHLTLVDVSLELSQRAAG